MTAHYEQREDLRVMQRAVRDGVSLAEARQRMGADRTRAVPGLPHDRDLPRPRSVRAVVGIVGLSVLLWCVVIAAAVAAGTLVTLLVWLLFGGVAFVAGWSIMRDVWTAIRWWRGAR